jgi:hypothetical protein
MDKLTNEKTKNLASGAGFNLSDIPVRKFYDQAQYIEKTLLPAIEKKTGNKSADYQFFQGVYDSLLYAVMILDRQNSLLLKFQQARQWNEFLQARADLCEKELLKYTTLEDLWTIDAGNKYAQAVARNVQNLLTNK